MRIVFFGSGAFGLPTLEALVERHEVSLILTQPDRPAGRGRQLTPTPVAAFAAARGLSVIKPESPNESDVIERIHAENADAFVVIAYGHKLSPALLNDYFAINLHGSLLPKYRGAAPINWAMINGERETGLSVIELAQRIDAGRMFATASTPIDPTETAGELHDRLAMMGPGLVLDVLQAHQRNALHPQTQHDAAATNAPKLTRADGEVDFDQPASRVRARIHGVTPWPGCAVQLGATPAKLCRVRDDESVSVDAEPGTLLDGGRIACNPGVIELLEIQPAGKRIMTFDEFARGHAITAGERCTTA